MMRLLLCLACVLLAAHAALLLGRGGSSAPVVPADPLSDLVPVGAMPASVPPGRELPPLASLSQMVQRPLFSPTRRPAATTPEPPAAVPVATPSPAPTPHPPPALSLTAVVRTPGLALALLRQAASGRDISVRRGDEVDGWQVQSIEAQQVVLVRDTTRHTLHLRVFEPSTPATPATRMPTAAVSWPGLAVNTPTLPGADGVTP